MKKYFESRQPVEQTLCVRGGKKVTVYISCARLHVCAHNKRRFVIALKYKGEKEYRYIVATYLTVLLSCSQMEGLGRTIIEAMGCGIPVIANSSGVLL